jgi:hypothetical protein
MNVLRAWIDPRIAKVRADAIRAYLLQHDWVQTTGSNAERWVFEGPRVDDGEPIILVVPTSEAMSAFRLRAEDIIGALGIIEDRYAREVLDDILKKGQTMDGAPANGTQAQPTPKRPRKQHKK